jgi:hypothetical protein
MKLVIINVITATSLPRQDFTVNLKELIHRHQNLNLSVATLHDNFRKLTQTTKTHAPNFKIENWYAWFSDNNKTLYIRYGHSGEPQIIVKEVEEA